MSANSFASIAYNGPIHVVCQMGGNATIESTALTNKI